MKYFSMFSGIGGFDLALNNLGHEAIGYSEIDKYAIQVFEKKFKGVKNYGDATKIKPEQLPDFDIICGGFPCQSFSIAGKRMGFKDTRGTLFFDIARIIKTKKPKIVFLENVKGLLSHDNGRTLTCILATLDELGYNCEWQVLNSKHFGVPQNRERIFIIGHIRGGSGKQIFPLPKNARQVSEVFGKEIISPTITTENAHGYDNTVTCGQTEAISKCLGTIEQTCKKRQFDTPKEINQFLKDNKGKLTIERIAKNLELPKTQVEHYFRTDKSRAVPSPKVWLQLKVLLKFTNTYDKQVMEVYEKEIEFEQTRRVYDSQGISPTLNATQEPIVYKSHRANEIREFKGLSPYLTESHDHKEGSNQPIVVAMRGRNLENPSDQTPGNDVEQRFEPNSEGTSNCLSTVEKDNYVATNKLRRLTPIECERLQGFPDNWTKEGIDGPISTTQRYKMMGNAVTVNVIQTIAQHFKED